MIVDDVWMVITSSNCSRRGMTYETEIGVTVTDAEVEDGVRKSVRDHRVRLWPNTSGWIDPTDVGSSIRVRASICCARRSTTQICR